MAVQLGSTGVPFSVDDIRMFLRDQPDWNILLDDIESTDDDIRSAMRLTVAKWNAIPPISNVTDPAQLNEYVLLCGSCGFLLKSEGLRQLRNQMQTQDGNISPVGLDEKEALYMRWAQHSNAACRSQFSQRLPIRRNRAVLTISSTPRRAARSPLATCRSDLHTQGLSAHSSSIKAAPSHADQ